MGVFYKLNQRLISEMVLIQNIGVKKKYLDKICNSKTSPAFTFFENIIYHGQKIFTYNNKQKIQNTRSRANTKEFLNKMPNILSQFISSIQQSAPTANCLTENILGLKQLHYELKYLATELDQNKIFTKKKLSVIFKSLKNVDVIFKKCKREQKMRLKKKKI